MTTENPHKNIKKMIQYSEDGITSKELFKNTKINSTLFCMAKGTKLSEHTSTKEGIIFVLEGQGVFTLEGKEIAMIPGVMISMNQNALHSLEVEENTAFILLLC